MLKLTAFILAMCFLVSSAAVIGRLDKQTEAFATTTPKDADILTTLDLTTIRNQELFITTTKDALSEDDKAAILVIDQTLLDSPSAKLTRTQAQNVDFPKFGKLLLLSTPKIAEKPKEPEEDLDEFAEENIVLENATQITPLKVTTENTISDDSTTIPNTADDEEITTKINLVTENQTDANEILKSKNIFKSDETHLRTASVINLSSSENITKLYPISDTVLADNNKFIGSGSKTKECSAETVEDQSKETPTKNPVSIALEKYKIDYVLMEPEVLDDSFTDINSELHLQPIVQSVEIVPSSLDHTLLNNYVSSW